MRAVLFVVMALAGTAEANRETATRVVHGPARELGMPRIVHLERCVGGCQITTGEEDDARQNISRIPYTPGVHTVSEFAFDDEVWTGIVQCLREVWSPYDVTFTETKPAPSELYSTHIIAGFDREVDTFAGGIAPIDEFCRPLVYAISYTFANQWVGLLPPDETALELCTVASQEIAHTYGLDHIFQFYNGDSSCSDPMTYRSDECGGQRFFRNRDAVCGEYSERYCRCGPNQRSHSLLLGKLGAGTPITTTEVEVTSPIDGAAIENGAVIVASGFSQRGVFEVTVLLNGYPWAVLPGAAFGLNGQPRSDYVYELPADVPDGVIDIEVIATDDIGTTASSKVTVTKGAPCVSEDSCAAGQACDAGRCTWPTPVGEVGDQCSYPQYCIEPRCETHDGDSHCTRSCVPDFADACEPGLECVADPDGAYCWPVGGGCCSASREPPWGAFMLGGVMWLALRRRRR